MNKMLKTLSVATLLAMASASALAGDEIVLEADHSEAPETVAVVKNTGQVRFMGVVAASTCRFVDGTDNQTVDLGQVESNLLRRESQTANEKNFSIKLTNCPLVATGPQGRLSNVVLSFDATSPALNTEGSRLTNTANSNAATNVEIELLQPGKDRGINLREHSESLALANASQNGELSFPFRARYFATGAATPGYVESSVNFKIDYK
ncbi:fimbrial protein [Neisseria weaveri]|uniref:S-fimbrillin n=1 Tax=Neisseria weaveri TaxID=28091 RepID=A0A448VHI8_9NEIS|nr:fimbrial protein [Neisseria weaveri]EGV36419.1 hypothetical protein l11_17630 [Neisseria weaveri LMG 5135]EGV38532.1 hypothetical protein l13_00650 [Neisseria weaveri ATCC 51223]SAY50858.1 S-fimbrillin [Neisseria weaveri]VEJ49214.1 S-fimbrillin [Neisseria weaveri]